MKKIDTAKELKKQLIAQFYKNNRLRLTAALAATVLESLGMLVISWLILAIVDTATGVEGAAPLSRLLIVLIVLLAAMICFYAVMYFTKPLFVSRAVRQYKDYAFESLSQKGIAAFSGENSSLYTSALSNDINSIEKSYLQSIFTLVTHAVLFTGAFAMMLYYSPLLTLATIAFSALPVIATLITGNRIAGAEKKLSDSNESYLAVLKDCLTGFSVVKSFKAEKQIIGLMAQQSKMAAQAKCRREKTALIVATIGLGAGVITQFGVFMFSAYLALSGKDITAGTIMLFVQLINFVVSPIGEVPVLLSERKAAKALIGKLADALALNVREEGIDIEPELKECIAAEKVSFSYDGEKNVLEDISIKFEAGKSYALVGASGSGKSTLLNLLMAANDGYSGSVRYDGTELREISSNSLYGTVSMIQQSVFVFNASVRDNITMFSDFPKEEVDRAIELSGISAMIAERGEDYLCGENGSGLSGGEKQRISIARSLLKKSSVLLVDEATAALDAQTAFQVSGAILGLEGLTRIVVTHALDEALLKQYDCIVALKSGRIAESGSFEELMEQKGYFYSLYTVSQ